MKLIIDTDPGVDDVIAIALAKALDEIEVLGLTTVFGNTHVEQSSRNARYLLDLLDWDIPVHEGAALPYGSDTYTPSSDVHGPEGFGARVDVPEIGQIGQANAAEFLVEMARKHAGELVICAIAPLTNIADAIKLDPEFQSNVKHMVIMGGALACPGNITPFAEANIYHDANAADAVFSSQLNLTLVGLDVTRKTLLRQSQIDELVTHSPCVGGFLSEITPFYLDFYRRIEGTDGCPMHDAAAILACIHMDRFKFLKTGVQVALAGENIGQTLPVKERKEVAVAVDLDEVWAVETLLRRLRTLK